eukprot:5167199-Pyramimonas_sp.AAC.2
MWTLWPDYVDAGHRNGKEPDEAGPEGQHPRGGGRVRASARAAQPPAPQAPQPQRDGCAMTTPQRHCTT